MTTSAHAAVSLLLLGRSERNAAPAALGAVAPDAPMFVFYVWERIALGTPESVIWSERYFDPDWQLVFDIPNSIPVLLAVLAVAVVVSRRRAAKSAAGAAGNAAGGPDAGTSANELAGALARLSPAGIFLASMIAHALGDLPLHREDAHRHFLPFSDWKFVSPVSYWDPEHYGAFVSAGETVLVLGASVFLFRRYRGRGRWIVAAVGGMYAVYAAFALLVWAGG